MTIERVYKDLCNAINDNCSFIKLNKLKELIEQDIRENTCYKTTKKTRVNAIKRVASKDDVRPILTGYGIYNDYKVVTDSYHMIIIKQDDMPLKLVTNDAETIKKLGEENCIIGVYPNIEHIIDFNIDNNNEYEEFNLDLDNMQLFYKLNKSKLRETPYHIGKLQCNVSYLKNVIDVLGNDSKIYLPKNSDVKPIYIKNKEEIGLVLPMKTY